MQTNKKILAIAMLITSASVYAGKIEDKSLLIPKSLGKLAIYHSSKGFNVKKDGKTIPVQRCYQDKELRGISPEKLAQFIKMGGYLAVNKFDGKNDYSVKLQGRLKGGGVGGATAGFWVGKGLTYFIAYSGILIASAVTGPAAPATFATLSSLAAVPLEATSNAVGLGVGMAGGVATGPV